SWDSYSMRVNNELVGVLGNLVHRVLTFARKNYAVVPEGDIEKEVFAAIENRRAEVINAVEEYEFKKLVDAVMALADFGNRFFHREEPWHLIKQGEEGRARAGLVIKNALQLLKAVCILLEPVMPEKMEEMWHQIGMESDVHSVKLDELMVPIESGQALGKPKMLFKRVET
ncbi:methionyl-tRNA synthetase, partial [Candidatus Methanophagaceae archaeon]